MNILITGANGQLGSSIRDFVPDKSTNRYIFTDVAELDITDRQAVDNFINAENVDVVVNCAAYTNVEAAEDNYEAATALNVDAVRNLSASIKMRNGFLIHISTDYVYGGDRFNTPISEEQLPNPTSAYGRTKLYGEQAILSSGVNHIIIRTAWLYSAYGKNFLKTILKLTSQKPSINVVTDQTGTPTWAGDLATAIISIIEQNKLQGYEGSYHFADEGVCSWFDFATAIAKESGSSCEILPCRSSEFPSKVIRPPYSVLDKTKFKKTFNMKIPHWTTSLELLIKNNKS